MDYKELLKRGLKKVPEKIETKERFEMPRMRAQIAGSRTTITNFSEVSTALRRDPKHLMKFLLKELATKGNLSGTRLEVQGNFSEEMVNRKLDLYVKTYVACPECGKHDTKLVKERGFVFINCEVCGARHTAAKI
ncbi:MAG: translation initiation factor IF-2 subunit beta [Candidatus Aenigmatarchaeota archaeon]|nr:MAG: translation initiation factor IF-2 subunit beta [Candidatus Aenigmarchaeota archaeon]